MVNEQMTGVRTGPTQGTGIKNNMSHVNKDGGQLRNVFNPT